MGDVADAIETVAEHLIATHVHDNHGRERRAPVPYRGTIDWESALMTMQKIGYDGTYLMELAEHRHRRRRCSSRRARARQRFERSCWQSLT